MFKIISASFFLFLINFSLAFGSLHVTSKKEEKLLQPETAEEEEIQLSQIDIIRASRAFAQLIGKNLKTYGFEVGGGSQRIHDILQEQIFTQLNTYPKKREEKFGFFPDALKYDAPPHLAIALGFERLLMILTQPASVAPEQLSELEIQIQSK